MRRRWSSSAVGWGECGGLPKAFISDSNAAFGAALENLGLEEVVTHEVVNHSEGFRKPRGHHTNPMERFWGTFTEWYEASSFRGFKALGEHLQVL